MSNDSKSNPIDCNKDLINSKADDHILTASGLSAEYIANNPKTIEEKILPLIMRINFEYRIKTHASCQGHLRQNPPSLSLKMEYPEILYFVKFLDLEYGQYRNIKAEQEPYLSCREELEHLHGYKCENYYIGENIFCVPARSVSFRNHSKTTFMILITSSYEFASENDLQFAFVNFEKHIDEILSKYQKAKRLNTIKLSFH
jgi:hypothetical protein